MTNFKMGTNRRLPQLAKLLAYILGRQPDEFGLVADGQGYVKIKDLLCALAEEDGFGYVRRGHLNELLLSGETATIEIDAERIRAIDRSLLPGQEHCADEPRQLFVCVRRRAHAPVLEHGIVDPAPPGLVLSTDRELALRIGRRRDASPVLFTVQPRLLLEAGVRLARYGQHLYLASALPPATFSGPAVQKEKAPPPRPEPLVAKTEPHPGSFYLKPVPDPNKPRGPKRGRNEEPEWKRSRHQRRRPKGGNDFDGKF
jgi:putative RNA 2'-phosphotransferase